MGERGTFAVLSPRLVLLRVLVTTWGGGGAGISPSIPRVYDIGSVPIGLSIARGATRTMQHRVHGLIAKSNSRPRSYFAYIVSARESLFLVLVGLAVQSSARTHQPDDPLNARSVAPPHAHTHTRDRPLIFSAIPRHLVGESMSNIDTFTRPSEFEVLNHCIPSCFLRGWDARACGACLSNLQLVRELCLSRLTVATLNHFPPQSVAGASLAAAEDVCLLRHSGSSLPASGDVCCEVPKPA